MASEGKRQTGSKRKVVRVIALLVLVYMAVNVLLVQKDIRKDEAALIQLEQEITDQGLVNAEYQQLLEKKDDPDYMEKVARESKSLQMIFPGEQVYYDITEK